MVTWIKNPNTQRKARSELYVCSNQTKDIESPRRRPDPPVDSALLPVSLCSEAYRL